MTCIKLQGGSCIVCNSQTRPSAGSRPVLYCSDECRKIIERQKQYSARACLDKEKTKKYMREYYQKNKGKFKEYSEKYRKSDKYSDSNKKRIMNPERKEQARLRALRYANSEKGKAQRKKYYASPAGMESIKRNQQSEAYRAYKLTPGYRATQRANCQRRRRQLQDQTPAEREAVKKMMEETYSKKSFICHWCKKTFPTTGRQLHFDHVQPLILGGKNNVGNLCTACRECNLRKQAKPIEQWAAEIGTLAI